VADPAGIRVFNGLRTHFVPWDEVEGFEASSRPFLLAIKRSNGRPLAMAGLTPGSFGNVAPQTEDFERPEGYWHRVTGRKSALDRGERIALSELPPTRAHPRERAFAASWRARVTSAPAVAQQVDVQLQLLARRCQREHLVVQALERRARLQQA
jgi:hypothetical protein